MTAKNNFSIFGRPMSAMRFSLLAIGVVLLSSCSRPDTFYQQGLKEARKGDYDKAIADYDKVIQLNPQFAQAYFSRADAWFKKNDFDAALKDYDEAIRLNPGSANNYLGRGSIYDFKHDNEKAIKDYSQVIRLDPKSAQAFGFRARIYADRGDSDKAIADANQALQFDPNNADAYTALGRAYIGYTFGKSYIDKADCDRAITAYSQAIQFAPHAESNYLGRGAAFQVEGRMEEAIRDFNSAVQIVPANAASGFMIVRGNAYRALGDKGLALGDESQSGPSVPKSGQDISSAQIDDYTRAIADYEAASVGSRQSPTVSKQIALKLSGVYLKRSQVCIQRHDYTNALADAAKATEYDSTNDAAYNTLAWIHATCPQADLRDGKKAVDEAMQACVLSEWNNPFTLGTLAAAYAEDRDFESAVKWENKQLESTALDENVRFDALNRLALYQAGKPYHDSPEEK